MRSVVSLLLLFAPTSLHATTIVALPESDLVARADAIVFGTVLATRTFVTPEGRARTRADLQVHKALRGARDGDVIVLESPGGKVAEGLVSRVDGAPTFRVGMQVFAFLEIHGDAHRPLGLSYGLLNVVRDRTGAYRVQRNLKGLSFVSPRGLPVAPASVRIDAAPLDEIMARVRTHLRGLPLPADIRRPAREQGVTP